jgi:O-antigen/teichoic acid export membrane protein
MDRLKQQAIKILRGTEQYTKTDMVYLARNGFWSLFAQGVGSLMSFVIVLLLANLLPKDTFGQYRFVLSIIPIFMLFTLPGTGTTLMRSVARGNIVDLPKIARTKVAWGLLGSLAAILTAIYYFVLHNTIVAESLLITAFFLPFVDAFYIYIPFYKGREDFKTPAVYDAIARVFQAIVLVGTALVWKNVVAIVVGYLAGQVLIRLFFYIRTLVLVRHDTRAAQQTAETDDTLSYGKHLSYINILVTIAGNLDKLLVWHFIGAEALAIYSIALTIPRNIVLLLNTVPRVAFPKFAKNDWGSDDRKRVIRKIFFMFSLLIIPAILYALLVPVVIPLIFKTYTASIVPAVILAITIATMPVNAMLVQVLYARKTVVKIGILQIIGSVIFCCVFVTLCAPLGVTAAAVALVAGEVASLILGTLFLLS